MRSATPLLALSVCLLGVTATTTFQNQDDLDRAVAEVERLHALRVNLAGAFAEQGARPSRQTFQTVCRPMGMEVQRVTRETGWTVQQLAMKYRNSANRPDGEAESVFGQFQRQPELMGIWIRTVFEGREGARYFRRIPVEQSCLACHGAAEERPDFVTQGYPDDRAFGFRVGDLRGLYSVFVPDP